MAIELNKQTAELKESVSVEEAENLMAWIQEHPGQPVDLSQCEHLHASVLQVLMAFAPTVQQWPGDANLKQWLEAALQPKKENNHE